MPPAATPKASATLGQPQSSLLKRPREIDLTGEQEVSSEPQWKFPRVESAQNRELNPALALMTSIQNGDVDAVIGLLRKWPRLLNACLPGERGLTPLCLAAEMGDVSVARALLNLGASVTGCSANRETALMLAAQFGHLEMIQLLLYRQAERPYIFNLDGQNSREALFLAIAGGHLEACKTLVSANVIFDFPQFNFPQILLQRLRLTPNFPNPVTALVYASAIGFSDFIQWLLETGKWKPDQIEPSRKTSLVNIAAASGQLSLVYMLIKHGASLSIPFQVDGKMLKNIWQVADVFGEIGIIEHLLASGISMNLQREDLIKDVNQFKSPLALDLLLHPELLALGVGTIYDGLVSDSSKKNPIYILIQAAKADPFSVADSFFELKTKWLLSGWSMHFINGDLLAYANLEPIVGDRSLGMGSGARVVAATEHQRFQMLIDLISRRIRSTDSFINTEKLTIKGRLALSQMLSRQQDLLNQAITGFREKRLRYLVSLKKGIFHNHVVQCRKIDEPYFYATLTRNSGLYDPVARAAIRLVKEVCAKFFSTSDGKIASEANVLKKIKQLNTAIEEILSMWGNTPMEIDSCIGEAKDLSQRDLLSDLLVNQWIQFCGALRMETPIWEPPQPLELNPELS